MAEQEYYYAVGRRKTSVATVRLFFKKGKSSINGKDIQAIYHLKPEQMKLVEPFKITDIDSENISFTAKTAGGGVMGQLDAIRLGLSRAIIKKFPDMKKTLKDAGFLTRDSRMVERKKAGLRKARKAEQYAKR